MDHHENFQQRKQHGEKVDLNLFHCDFLAKIIKHMTMAKIYCIGMFISTNTYWILQSDTSIFTISVAQTDATKLQTQFRKKFIILLPSSDSTWYLCNICVDPLVNYVNRSTCFQPLFLAPIFVVLSVCKIEQKDWVPGLISVLFSGWMGTVAVSCGYDT